MKPFKIEVSHGMSRYECCVSLKGCTCFADWDRHPVT